MTYRETIRNRLLDGESIIVSELARELGCTEPTVHQTMATMRDEGYDFRRETLPRQGAPNRYTVITRAKREPTIEERLERVERILAAHNLGTGIFL